MGKEKLMNTPVDRITSSSSKPTSYEMSHGELQQLLDNMISPFSYYKMVYDENGTPVDYIFIYVNEAFEKETGLTKAAILGKRVLEVLPNTEAYWIERCGHVAKTGIPDNFRNFAAALNNWYEARVYSPQPDHFAMTVNNITDSVKKQAALEQSVARLQESERKLYHERELFKTTLLSIGDGVICTDDVGRITMLNESAAHLTGWSPEDAMGVDSEQVFYIINEYSKEKVLSPIREVLRTIKHVGLGNHVQLLSRDGIARPIADCASPILSSTGSLVGTVLVFRDVTDSKEKQKKIEYLGYHDQLTGLYNRRFFEMELERLNTRRRLPMTLVMGDLNGLKFTNDAFGHSAGDALLVSFSEILKRCIRHDDIICRYGGDEFIMILPNTDYTTASEIVVRITAMLKHVYVDKGFLSVAFGWETKIEESEDIYQVLKKAEDSMYKKKLFETPSIRSSAIQMVQNTLYEKSTRESLHSMRVSELCARISRALYIDESQLSLIKMAGRLHDIGKIILLNGIIDKPDLLSADEWREVRRHPEIGYRILSNTAEFGDISMAVLEHHERWDGDGYPKGLRADDISLAARIIAVADAFDAMTVSRPYRHALSFDAAVLEIAANAGKQFDPEIVRAFLQIDLSDI